MESYLGVAAYVQNGGAKPPDRSRRESSQGGAAMCRREEASSLDRAGRHLSRHAGRVSPSRTKPSRVVSRGSWRTPKAVRSPGETVRPAFRPGKGFLSLTEEVPRSSSSGSISCGYKARPKGGSQAPAGREQPLPGPALRDVSSAKVRPGRAGAERQNHRALPAGGPVHGTS